MSSAEMHLSTYGVTMEVAYQFVMDNVTTPSVVHGVCKNFGVTNTMLAEIVGRQYSGICEVPPNFWTQS